MKSKRRHDHLIQSTATLERKASEEKSALSRPQPRASRRWLAVVGGGDLVVELWRCGSHSPERATTHTTRKAGEFARGNSDQRTPQPCGREVITGELDY